MEAMGRRNRQPLQHFEAGRLTKPPRGEVILHRSRATAACACSVTLNNEHAFNGRSPLHRGAAGRDAECP
jgi:hypothetical protein